MTTMFSRILDRYLLDAHVLLASCRGNTKKSRDRDNKRPFGLLVS